MNQADLVSVDEKGNFSMSVIIGGNAKRSRTSSNSEQEQEREQDELIGGLPDHLAQVILSAVNRPSILYSVSRSWRKLIYSPSFPPFLCMYAILSTTCSSSIEFMCLDPISLRWCSLPPPPQPDLLLTRHPSFIARSLPVQAVSVGNHLVILAATTQDLLPALSRPLIFSPLTKLWRLGPPISTPRRWCAAGSLGQTVYLASGVGSSGYTQDVARSAQKWVLEPDGQKWENVAPLKHKHGRFSREAVEAVGWRGRLCLVNVKGNVVKEGVVYDRERDAWEDMNQGLLAGWNGPAASMDEDVIYCVDQANGLLMRYDSHAHSWDTILHSPELLEGAAQVVARGGRVCVVRPAPAPVVVLDVVARPPKVIFLLHPPRPDMTIVSLHVLPRMPSLHTFS